MQTWLKARFGADGVFMFLSCSSGFIARVGGSVRAGIPFPGLDHRAWFAYDCRTADEQGNNQQGRLLSGVTVWAAAMPPAKRAMYNRINKHL